MGLIRGLQVQIWAKLTSFATVGPISPRMTIKKALINTFSGSTNLLGLLGDSGPSNITGWYVMGLIRGLQVQIWAKLTSLATFGPISPRWTV